MENKKMEKVEEIFEIKFLKANSREYEVEAMTKEQIKKLICTFVDWDVEFYIGEGTGDLVLIEAHNLENFVERFIMG